MIAGNMGELQSAGNIANGVDLLVGCAHGLVHLDAAVGVLDAGAFKVQSFHIRRPAGGHQQGGSGDGLWFAAILALQRIAVIGMAGRFPGAKDIDQYWENLRDGKETIRHFSKEELRGAKIVESSLNNPQYVRARGIIEGAEQFDPAFFGLSPRQAEILDPQQRVWLECVQEALEDAGFTGNSPEEVVGVFAGARESTYLLNNLCIERTSQERLLNLSDWDAHQSFLNNERDSIATRTRSASGVRLST